MARRVMVGAVAPDLELADFEGRLVTLSQFRNLRHVVLVFNRGFT